jgi:hypothetical protein
MTEVEKEREDLKKSADFITKIAVLFMGVVPTIGTAVAFLLS